MKSISKYALAATATLAAAPASAATLDLEPSSEWRVREYDDKCRMIRTFGEGEDAVTLWLDKASDTRFLNMTVIGRPFRSPYGNRVTLAFRPGESISRGYIRSTSNKGRPVLSMFGIAPISFELASAKQDDREGEEEIVDFSAVGDPSVASSEVLAERYDAVEAIELSGALVQKVSLQTGGLASMSSELQQCADAIPKKRADLRSKPSNKGQGARTTGEQQWASQIQANYPVYLLREMAQGSVGVRVQINPQGRVTFCDIVSSNGAAV